MAAARQANVQEISKPRSSNLAAINGATIAIDSPARQLQMSLGRQLTAEPWSLRRRVAILLAVTMGLWAAIIGLGAGVSLLLG